MKKPSSQSGLVFLLVLFGAGGFFLIYSLISFASKSYKVKFFPLLISCILIALCAAELIKMMINHIRSKGKEQSEDEYAENAKKHSVHIKLAVSAAWLLALAASLWLFGFFISLPLFSFAYLRYHKAKWLVCIIVAVSVFLVIYFGFGMALRVRLHNGIVINQIFRK